MTPCGAQPVTAGSHRLLVPGRGGLRFAPSAVGGARHEGGAGAALPGGSTPLPFAAAAAVTAGAAVLLAAAAARITLPRDIT